MEFFTFLPRGYNMKVPVVEFSPTFLLSGKAEFLKFHIHELSYHYELG